VANIWLADGTGPFQVIYMFQAGMDPLSLPFDALFLVFSFLFLEFVFFLLFPDYFCLD